MIQPYVDKNGKECTLGFGSKFCSCPDCVVTTGTGENVGFVIVPIMANGKESKQACMLLSREATTTLCQCLGAALEGWGGEA